MKTALFIILVAFALQACAPEPVLRLKSQAEEERTSYYQGVEYVYQQKDSVEVIVSYYEHTANLFAMTIEVFNNSDRVIRVDPANFFYEAFEGNQPTEGALLNAAYAKNPERKMLSIDKQLSRQRAEQKGDNAWFFIAHGFNFIGAVAAESPEEREEASESLVSTVVFHQADRDEFRYDQYSLKQRRKLWRLDALRITDLLPGESVRGLVFFMTNPNADLYDILIDVDDLRFDFWFRQLKYYP